MLKLARLQILVSIALGMSLGYVAASGHGSTRIAAGSSEPIAAIDGPRARRRSACCERPSKRTFVALTAQHRRVGEQRQKVASFHLDEVLQKLKEQTGNK